MSKKKISIVWCISLLVIAVASIIIAGAKILGQELPDTIVRILGILELLAIPVLCYTSVRRINKRKCY